ncbi:MAG: T9SS type A sorting domain-containing protein [Bacteroidota bacterium]
MKKLFPLLCLLLVCSYAWSQPRFDLRALSLDIGTMVDIEKAPFVLKGSFQSFGTQELVSVDLYYAINDGTPVKYTLREVPNSLVMNHGVPWIPEEAGTYKIDFWLENPNGEDDSNPGDNQLTQTVIVADQVQPKLALIEAFTQWNCGPCAAFNPALDNLIFAHPEKTAAIKYTGWWPGSNNDERYLFNPNDNGDRISYYTVNGVPTTVLAGNEFRGSPASVTLPQIQNEYNDQNRFFLDQDLSVDEFGELVVAVKATQLATEKSSANLVLRVAVVQDERIFASAPGTNGEREFFDIMRYMLPSQAGTALTNQAGEATTVNGKYAIVPRFEGSFLHLVSFVQNDQDQSILAASKSPGIYICPSGDPITHTLAVSDASCGKEDGTIQLSVDGGLHPFSFSWQHDGSVAPNLTDLAAGTYEVQVSDTVGCSFDLKVVIGEKPGPRAIIVGENTSCKGTQDGSATLYVAGGKKPYAYQWLHGETTATANGLAPASYSVTVEDANGCKTALYSTQVKEPSVAEVKSVVSSPDDGSGNGSVTIEVSGGTPPYNFDWKSLPNQRGATAENLSPGTYEVSITDANDCPVSDVSVTIIENADLVEKLAEAGINQMSVFPNPSMDGNFQLDLILAESGVLNVKVYDPQGRVCWASDEEGEVLSYSELIDLTGRAAGIYALEIKTAQGKLSRKIMVQ